MSQAVFAAGGLSVEVEIALSTAQTPERAVLDALDNVCGSLAGSTGTATTEEASLARFCNVFTSPDIIPEEKLDAAREMSARSASAETSVGTYLPGGVSMPDFSKRLAMLRRAAQSSSLAKAPAEPIMVAALGSIALSDEVPEGESRFSGFVNLNVNNYEQDETLFAAGFSGSGNGLVLGSDYRFNNQMFAGAALNYSNQDMDILDSTGDDKGTLAMNDTGLTFYTTYSLSDTLYLDGVFNYGKQEYELQRYIDINFTTPLFNDDAQTKSNPTGTNLALSLGSGWQTEWEDNSIDITGNLYYGNSTIDKFSETNGEGYNLTVDKQNIKTLRLNLGGGISRAFSTGFGVLLPQFTLHMIHEFDTSGQKISASFSADPSSSPEKFSYVSEERDSDYFTAALGVSLLSAGGLTTYLQYDTVLAMENYTQSNISLGARMEF